MSISSPALVSARSSTRLKSSRAQIKAASFRYRPTRKDWLFLLTPPKAPSPFKNNNQRQEKFGNKGVQQRNILTLRIQGRCQTARNCYWWIFKVCLTKGFPEFLSWWSIGKWIETRGVLIPTARSDFLLFHTRDMLNIFLSQLLLSLFCVFFLRKVDWNWKPPKK